MKSVFYGEKQICSKKGIYGYMEFLTVKEVAKILKCSQNHVRYLCVTGQLQATNIGKKESGARKVFRIPKREIEKLHAPQYEPTKVTSQSFKDRWKAYQKSNM